MVTTVEFCKSVPDWKKMGYTDKPEYAFIGRSNVGKSSLINLLVNRKNFAKTSGTPGKTQTLNLFLVNRKWNLVDLPGYGYAKSAKKLRKEWLESIEGYFINRKNLVNAFVLIDASIPPKDKDIRFCNWMGEQGVPFSLVFTKTDKAKTKAVEQNIADFEEALSETWEEIPPVFHTSIKNPESVKSILDYIQQLNEIVLSNQA